jgi:hypothetical protein
MTFQSFESVADLPPEGPLSAAAREKHDLDFKEFTDRATPWEHAKDIAAFANALGGTILVGSSDKPNVVHHGLKNQTAHEVRNIYEGAALMCSPTVPIDVVPINFPDGKVVVAVNVPPFPESVVGAPEETNDKNGKPIKAEHGWRFPIRRASQTHYLKPEELPLYMNPNVRRAFVRLQGMPLPCRARIHLFYVAQVTHMSGTYRDTTALEVSFEGVSLEQNRAQFQFRNLGFRVPLMDVIDVWDHEPNFWAVRVAGTVELSPAHAPEKAAYRPLA